jgi:hypothetical protein
MFFAILYSAIHRRGVQRGGGGAGCVCVGGGGNTKVATGRHKLEVPSLLMDQNGYFL